MTWAKRQPRPDRSAEFAGYVPRPREVARSTGIARLLVPLPEPMDPGPSSAAGRAHMGRVAALGCILCRQLGYGEQAAEVHHVRTGQGAAQRASDWLTVPLCPDCHRGPNGVHGDRARLKSARVTEMDLLAQTIALLTKD
jgi:hypothetical protein